MIPEVRACSIPVPYHPALPHQPDISTERRGPGPRVGQEGGWWAGMRSPLTRNLSRNCVDPKIDSEPLEQIDGCWEFTAHRLGEIAQRKHPSTLDRSSCRASSNIFSTEATSGLPSGCTRKVNRTRKLEILERQEVRVGLEALLELLLIMGSDFVKHLGLALWLDDRSGSRHRPPEPFVRDRTHLPYGTDEREPLRGLVLG
jgi:hypothetical protein